MQGARGFRGLLFGFLRLLLGWLFLLGWWLLGLAGGRRERGRGRLDAQLRAEFLEAASHCDRRAAGGGVSAAATGGGGVQGRLVVVAVFHLRAPPGFERERGCRESVGVKGREKFI